MSFDNILTVLILGFDIEGDTSTFHCFDP